MPTLPGTSRSPRARPAGPSVWLALVLAGTACSDPVSPITAADVTGTYALRTIAGQGAPWVLGTDTWLAEQWTLAADGTSIYRVTRRAADGSPVVSTSAGVHWTLNPAGSQAPRGAAVLRIANEGAPEQYYEVIEYRVERTGGTLRLTLMSPGYSVYVYDRAP